MAADRRLPAHMLSAAGYAPGQVPVATGSGGFKPGSAGGGGLLGAAYVTGTMGTGLAEATTHDSTAISIDEEHGDHGISTDGSTLDVAEGIYIVTLFAGPVFLTGGASTDITEVRLVMMAAGNQLFGGTSSNELSVTMNTWFGSGASGYTFQFTFDVLSQTGRTASLSGNSMSANILRFPFPS